MSLEMLQHLINNDIKNGYQTYFILSDNMGVQAKFLRMARFNPKPYLTLGWNPVNYLEKDNMGVKDNKWYLMNFAFNFGLDFDIWITNYFGISISYENTSFLSNSFDSLFDEDDMLFIKYSKVKIGIMF
jgi:hypothetical protein